MAPSVGSAWQSARHTTAGGPTMTDIDLSDLAVNAWGRIEVFFAAHLN
jgi:hypothetical protein